jgi:endonuclease/exonuclease/phosphatase (EEP) superfamily protein YafD
LVTPSNRTNSRRSVLRIADTLVLYLGMVFGLASIASNGGFFSARLDLIGQFAPVWALGSGLAATYGACLASAPRRTWLVGLGLAGMIACALLIVPEFARPIRPTLPSETGYRIKVIEYNAWVRNPDIERDADWLASQNPDFIFMADADATARRALTARGFICTRGVADTVIFSRLPRALETYVIPGPDWPLLPSFSRASFNGAGGDFTVIATHLKRPTSGPRVEQQAALLRLIDHYDRRRLIVAGDFNSTPWSFDLRRLDQQLGLERRDRALFTWPALYSPVAFLPIDHIYAGEAWRTVSIARGPRLGSDHYPIVVTLALTSGR